ncbi:MAG: Ribosomal large subunit pseudouridine synthase D (EC [uncultured Sulfurovum sp.]|uniref:RNA pseudouridylate synthase n=1 Tax=uncultured Sulfurovum sp. TaxID=269237 RepID=A0A6S6RU81_9BACT|nr:MAG: Ribosomal large subunit pseudouridine synthase D (EC [uncultured Sulfurovum sp.]
MPFVKEKYHIEEETIAFLYVMHTLRYTQGQAQRHIAKGRLLINGVSMTYTGQKIQGDVEMVFFRPQGKGLKPTFQNKDFMLFEKPSGVLVHPNTMATPYSMLDEVRSIAGDNANGTHRIDMETSGLFLASKHKKAETYLKGSFENRTIKKSYLAWVDGNLTEPFSSQERIKVNKDGYENTKHKVFISDEGKPAKTDFIPLEYDEILDTTLVACYPHSGRLHQIRIHLFHVKHPILGDPIYGASYAASDDYLDMTQSEENRLIQHGAPRLMLHAQSLSFTYGSKFYIESKKNFVDLKSLIYPKELRVFNRS